MKTETISFFHRKDKHAKKHLVKWVFEHNLIDLNEAFDVWSNDCDDVSDVHAFMDYIKTIAPSYQIKLLVCNH